MAKKIVMQQVYLERERDGDNYTYTVASLPQEDVPVVGGTLPLRGQQWDVVKHWGKWVVTID